MKNLIRMTFVTVFGIALLCAVSVARVEASLILTLDDISTSGVDATVTEDGDNVFFYSSVSGVVGSYTVTYALGSNTGGDDGLDLFLTALVTGNGDGDDDTVEFEITLTQTDISAEIISAGYTTSFPGGTDGTVTLDTYDEYNEESGTYSITMVAGISVDGSTSFTAEVEPVPEPATLALLGIGLVGLVGAGIRKQRNKKS